MRKAMAAGLILALGAGFATSANAGFLDFIFGWRKPAPVVEARHPNVTIQRAKPRRVASERKRSRVARAPRAAPAVQISPKDVLAGVIDPVRNPNWWLEDPTLRKGDVLVLADRVLVFTGGPVGAPQSYAALAKSRLLTRRERVRIAAMTGGRREPPTLAGGAPRQPVVLEAASLTGPVEPPVLGAPRS